MNKPKLRSALSDSVGICELCKKDIVSDEVGYIEFFELDGKFFHKECCYVDSDDKLNALRTYGDSHKTDTDNIR